MAINHFSRLFGPENFLWTSRLVGQAAALAGGAAISTGRLRVAGHGVATAKASAALRWRCAAMGKPWENPGKMLVL